MKAQTLLALIGGAACVGTTLFAAPTPENTPDKFVRYVEATGSQYVDTGIVGRYNTKAECKVEWMEMADNNMTVALLGKFLPQTLVWLAVVYSYQYYVFFHLGFPHLGSPWMLVLLGLMQVLASQGFGIFAFGLMPSLRMSMSICSLWAVLSISMAGSAFPVMGMDRPLQSLSWLFPLRHYYMIYQTCVFNGFPLIESWFHFAALAGFMLLPFESWFHFVALAGFMLLPWMVVKKIKNAMLTYVYIP